MSVKRSFLGLACVGFLLGPSQTAQASSLSFTTIYDASVDAAAQAAINNVLAGYSALFSDPVNVTLKFINSGNGLGSSSTYSFDVPYLDYVTALHADSTSAADATATSFLPISAINPVNGTGFITQGRAGLAAIGITADVSGIADYFDGVIDLNLALLNYDRVSIDPAKYDLQAVTQHEINEVLGTISNVGGSNPRPSDLFRVDSSGGVTFTTAGDDAYFSIDHLNLLARFNQDSGGDYGDWWSAFGGNVPQVQDAFSTPGATPNMNVEKTLLDVVGWNVVPADATPVPEPGSLLLLGTGVVAMVNRRRLKRRP